MRRVLGGVLLGLGVLLVVGAALVKWVAAPALVKIPDDVNLTTVAQGSSQVFVLQAQAVHTVPVIATRIVRSDAKAGTSSVGVFDETLCLRNGAGITQPGPDGCVPNTDPAFVQRTTDRVAFDRKTALAVPNGQQYGAAVNGDPSIRHVGLSYTFPIDTEKKSYPFFDTVVGKAYPMNYRGTEKLNGLDVYRFEQAVPDSDIKIQDLLPGKYSNVRVVWVEPTTGVIVKGSEQIKETFAAGGQTAFSGTLVFNDASVKSQADYAKKQLSKVHLIRIWIPLTLAVLGVVLIVVGLLLLLRRRRSPVVDEAPQVSSQT
jgi:Porin PorA